MALERDLELLDDYLSNRMNSGEREAFEKRIQGDPELSNELKVQQSLVKGIRQTRVTELKSMLNAIPVTSMPPSQTSILTKIGGWAIVGGIIATATYFYFDNNSDNNPIEITPKVVEQSNAEQAKEQIAEPQQPVATEAETVPESIEKPSEKVTPKPAVKTKANPVIEVYDPTKEEGDESIQKYEKEQLEIISKAFVTSSMEVQINNSDKKYNFHYEFNAGRLFLYGAFERNLYEILEFISQDKRTVVLYYENNYYLLDISKSTPTLLTPIKNKQLLKKLHDYRSK